MLPIQLISSTATVTRNGKHVATLFLDVTIERHDEQIDVLVQETSFSEVCDTIFRYLPTLASPYFVAPPLPPRSGHIVRYKGRVLPPKVVVRAPWDSATRMWFEAEEMRFDETFTAADKFDLRFDTLDSVLGLRGCLVRAVTQEGSAAIIELSADILDL
jgi:hypothetical protein